MKLLLSFCFMILLAGPLTAQSTIQDPALLPKDSAKIFIPNSWNNEESEWWIPQYSTPPDSCKLQIFNRWGELIFETDRWDKGWDATTKKGDPVQGDTYVYRLAVKFSGEDKKRVITGHVTIIR